MKKSKLTGALAVGGGLKHAVVPYIITGEENNGYSKGDILDANYVKQLINNNTIPSNISADALTLKYGTIFTDGTFSVIDKNDLSKEYFAIDHGTAIFNDNVGNYMFANKDHFNLNTDVINISGVTDGYASLNAKLRSVDIQFSNNFAARIDPEEVKFGEILFLFYDGTFQIYKEGDSDAGFYLDQNFVEFWGTYIRTSAKFLEMTGRNNSGLIQYNSKDGSGNYKEGDVAFYWDTGNLFLNKIYKPTQTISEKDLFERVSDLETPKTTREDNPKVGQCVFDTTLGKPIWCKTAKTDTTAAVWVDATGATV